MRVLVSGVTGLIGSELARALAARGDEVWGLTRDPSKLGTKLPAVARGIGWSTDAPLTPESLDGVGAVVHLAGETVAGRWTDARKKVIEASRIEGTRAIVSAIAARPSGARPSVLVSASAIGYYGDTGERDVTERDGPADDFLARVCKGWEREAQVAEQHGVRVVLPRIGLVLSTRGGALKEMLPMFRLGAGGPIGAGTQWWPWIHVDDVVKLILWAIDTPSLSGPVNATAPSPARQSELAAALGRALHRPAFLPAPAFAMRALLGEFSHEVLASRKILPARAQELGFQFQYPEIDGALRQLVSGSAKT